ncbi:MAG: 3-hydroxybutyryl-CoA dehydrogenase [Planctomycetes bacterium]|nr:3-hydroxybutyryl-CoA dehydrogenase [Planctomycetota bacterium]
MSRPVERVAVIGAGTMGAGIAHLAATKGCSVTLIDVSADLLSRAIGQIGSRLDRSVAKGRVTAAQRKAILDRISPVTRIAELSDVELVIEAVVEVMEVKQKVFRALDDAAAAKAVLATNTSSLSVSQIGAVVEDPGRVVGMHFFNPPVVMPLVEIVAANQSGPEALALATQTARAWGKVPVRAKDTPGFIVNRVARGFYLESLRMLGEGVAGVKTIDEALRKLGGFRMGPFQLMDLVGIDVNYTVSCSVWERFGKPPRLTPHEIQSELVSQGRLGRKTSRGFYRYDCDPPAVDLERSEGQFEPSSSVRDAVVAFVESAALCDAGKLGESAIVDHYAFARVVVAIMNEAALALMEGVASSEDIDTAMQRGTNYPLGPLAWARRTGYKTVVQLLEALDGETPDGRFAAATLYSE